MTIKEKKIGVWPLHDRVLLKEIKKTDTKTTSGIIIPGLATDDRAVKKGTVVAIGPGKTEDGKIVPLSVKVGDTVLFFSGSEIVIDGEEYFIVDEYAIPAILN